MGKGEVWFFVRDGAILCQDTAVWLALDTLSCLPGGGCHVSMIYKETWSTCRSLLTVSGTTEAAEGLNSGLSNGSGDGGRGSQGGQGSAEEEDDSGEVHCGWGIWLSCGK